MRPLLQRLAVRLLGPVIRRTSPVRFKELHELSYWRERKEAEGVLGNQHYEHFYTAHFGLDAGFYGGKVVIDIGCGPRGSLEWATTAARRIGVDPLANEYLRLGADRHRMEYIAAPSEHIPLPDASCDVICSFNSLDHVEDVGRTISEIKRLCRPGGLFLLLVEVNHEPTETEPHFLTARDLIDSLAPQFTCEQLALYRPGPRGMYESIREGQKLPDPETSREIGFFSARFQRSSAS